MNTIVCEKLRKEYQIGETKQVSLNDIDLTIHQGDYLSITGRSGSGKSTLLNLIGLIDLPTAGKIYYDQTDVTTCSEQELARIRNQTIGYVFQSFYLEPDFTVYQNVELPLLISGIPKSKRHAMIERALESVHMLHKMKQKAASLSGGEKQRICIARALINDPQLILADEPCGNLDSENSAVIMDILDSLHKDGKTILLVTHNEEDAKRSEKNITIKDGCILHET